MVARNGRGRGMTQKWALFVDVARCHNCRNCFIACKDEHVDNDYPGYAAPQPRHGHAWIDIRTRERGAAPMVDVAHVPVMCNHCEDAPCMKAAPDAVSRRPDGIVIIDPVKAKGRRDLVDACPYGAIHWNEERALPQAWIFDAHLLDRGFPEPRCSSVCPTGALVAARLDDEAFSRKCAEEGFVPLHPEHATKPRVVYRNLHRYESCFVGGTLVATRGGVEDCVPDARIGLTREGQAVGTAASDAFGEFKIDGLPRDSGTYELLVEAPGLRPLRLPVTLGESVYLGFIDLAPP